MTKVSATILTIGALILTGAFTLSVFQIKADDSESVPVVRDDSTLPVETEINEPDQPISDDDFALPTPGNGVYLNGTFTASLKYTVPSNHEEDMSVTFTLEDDVITDSALKFGGEVGTSRLYQAKFEKEYVIEVVGKIIDDVEMVRVGSASLTTAAFNEALVDIKDQAKG